MQLSELWDLNKFIAWLRTKPSNMEYDYTNTRTCLIAQYARAHGFEDASVSTLAVRANGEWSYFPHIFNGISLGFIDPDDGSHDWSYGDALERALRYAVVG
jgi:hypothetical protein